MPEVYRRRGSENWWIDITVAGRRYRESTKTPDKGLAEDIASKRAWELRRAAVFGAESVLTFGAATALYLDAGKSDRFVLPLFNLWERVLLKDITAGAIKAAARTLYPVAGPATWNRQAITPAQAIINHAAELGHCAPIRVRRFAVPKTRRQAVDRSYIDRFRANAPADLGAMVLFMFQSGCRISVATALEWSRVDLQARTATIGKDKNGDPHEVHLTTEMVAALANLPKDRRKVFGYASRHSVYGVMERACQRAGLPYLATHQPGRHSFATELIVRNNVDVATTAKLGNWRSARVLLDNYVHAEREGDIIERVFGPRGTPTSQSTVKPLRRLAK
jgi:integrase